LADAIDAARREHDVWAYVFMPEHVHILLWPRRPEYDIAAILKANQAAGWRLCDQHLRQHSPAWLARITVKKGAKWERRFWQPGGGFDRNVTDPRRILLMIDYIHNNPLRRKPWKSRKSGNGPKPDGSKVARPNREFVHCITPTDW